MARENLSKIDRARIKLWTSHDMSFVIRKGDGIGVIPRFTKCEKVPYDHRIKEYLMKMESRLGFRMRPDGDKAVCVDLMGQLRYIWRSDLLTKKEYEDVKKRERKSAIRVLGSKSKRAVGKGSEDGRGD